MVSMDQDHAFLGQHLLQLGTRSGYCLTVVSRVSCSRIVCRAARLEGTDSFTTDHFHPMILEGSFRLLNLDKTEAAAWEQSRRRQEATKRGSSTTRDKPDNSTASVKTSEKKSASARANECKETKVEAWCEEDQDRRPREDINI